MLDDDKIEDSPQKLLRRAAGGNRRGPVGRIRRPDLEYTLSSKLSGQQSELADAKQENVNLQAELRETDARLKVATEELGNSLGLTQKQMDARAQEIIRREAG